MFCWHKWSKWIVKDEGELKRISDWSTIGKFIYQERSCEKCGKIQLSKQQIF